MAMNVGSVNLNTGSGSGLAKEMYDLYIAAMVDEYPGTEGDENDPPFNEEAARRPIGIMCNVFAQAVVQHLQDNAEVTVDVNDSAHLDLGATTTGTLE